MNNFVRKTDKRIWLLVVLSFGLYLSFGGATASAQSFLTGQVVDDQTGDSIPMASVIYYGHHVGVASDIDGHFRIQRHNGWKLTFSALGYEPQTVNVTTMTRSPMIIRMKSDAQQIEDVVVSTKRGKYSRKNNPAVELMKKVIAHKKLTDLSRRDFYQYDKYQKITLALNDLKPSTIENNHFFKAQWMKDQVEVCPYNNKLILPLSVDETVTQQIYRRDPHAERTIIKGQKTAGVGDLFQTGDIVSVVAKDFFADVNIYDDQIRILQHPMTSPIGKAAINFYRYYIQDTVYVERDKCIHLHYMPNNQLDFGFRGDIYILADSSYQVKRCELTIPEKSSVNWIESFRIEQEFTQLPDSTWVLTVDDMIAELELVDFVQKAVVIRTTRLTDYAFDELPHHLFRGKKREVREEGATMRDEAFWSQYRRVSLTKSEESMDSFVDHVTQIKGFKYIMIGLKALMENFVETGKPSKVDIGPINTVVSKNFVDGFRTRVSLQTTANFSPHWFFSGYYARGWGSKKNYYKTELTYSFNEKEYLPREFPKRNLTFTSTYDVMAPTDKFLSTDKDNVFTAFKWTKVDKMMFYNRQQLTFEREEDFGFTTKVSLKTEENEAAGALRFTPLSALNATPSTLNAPPSTKFRTTELRAELEYCPGATYINTKQRRRKVNLDAPIFTVSHAIGIKNILGGDYSYNYTEASIYKRFWFASWGKADFLVKGGIQWERVPFPLLIMPETNLSYIVQKNTFETINNMEFLTDRFLAVHFNWDLNGKLFNRVPLLKKLKWREFIGVRCMWGDLTDQNNPTLAENAGSPLLMQFPEGTYIIDPKRPYWEVAVGIHNIFNLLHVQYVRRLSYNDLPTANKHGIRVKLSLKF